MKKSLVGVVAILFASVAIQAQANVKITEVAPWASGNSPISADWFELTNTGNSAVSISGWKVDDNSNSFAAAVALSGLSSINAGQSAIFVEGNATKAASFISNWFGANVPANFAIGYYSGSGIGLGAGGDALNIYNASGVLQANVTFGASDAVSPFQTFDNAAGLSGAISQLSMVGTNGAFVAANSAFEIGSPGTIAAVPEPETFAMMGLGLGLIGLMTRRRKQK
ncbi:MAG: lamin tail domain-containing protein [Methylotenera sp.]|nr:lamin tail domain-containing protein [Methylotenera sp.]